MRIGVRIAALWMAFGVAIAVGHGAAVPPTLDPLVTGSSIVSGVAVPGSSPISIYDTTYPARLKIGTANATAHDGKFYCAVKPRLAAGHTVIAIDKNGSVSAVSTVTQKNPGGVSPAPQ